MSFRETTPPVVLNLVIINAIAFLATVLAPSLGNKMIESLALFNADSELFRIWQPITYMFLHGGFSHLFFNMFALWMFGRTLEYALGSRRFLTYYLVCGLGAGLIQLLVGLLTHGNPYVPTIGASGAVFGLLLGYGVLYPNSVVMLILPPVRLKAKWFVAIYGVIELFFGVTGTMDSVAHFAHIGGMLWGLPLILYWKRQAQKGRGF